MLFAAEWVGRAAGWDALARRSVHLDVEDGRGGRRLRRRGCLGGQRPGGTRRLLTKDEDVCGPVTCELVEQSMNPDAFGGEEAVKERLVEHEAKRQKQDPQSAEGARRQDLQNQQEVQACPTAGAVQ